jgi:hypothetical protein
MTPLAPHITAFFQQRLPMERPQVQRMLQLVFDPSVGTDRR